MGSKMRTIIALGLCSNILTSTVYAIQYVYIQNQTIQIFDTKHSEISNTNVLDNTKREDDSSSGQMLDSRSEGISK
jgi:hypothetical protein